MSTILIVDDDRSTRELIKVMLPGHAITEAIDGDTAITAFDAQDPVIVLLDLNMPGRDGLDVLQHIRDYSIRAHIIVITAIDDESTVTAALNGADDILLKPIQPAVLKAKVNKAINSHKYKQVLTLLDDIKALLTRADDIMRGEEAAFGRSGYRADI